MAEDQNDTESNGYLGTGGLFSGSSVETSTPSSNASESLSGLTTVRGPSSPIYAAAAAAAAGTAGAAGPPPGGTTDPYVPTIFQEICQPTYVKEQHTTVIKRGPTTPPTLEMYSYTRADLNADGLVDIESIVTGDYLEEVASDNQPISRFFNADKNRKQAGDEVILPLNAGIAGATPSDFQPNDTIIISHEYVDIFGITRLASCRAVVNVYDVNFSGTLVCTLLTNTVGFPIDAITEDD